MNDRHKQTPIMPGRTGAERMPRQMQPRAGEIVLTCGHGPASPLLDHPDDRANPSGWFEYFPPVVVAGPGGAIEARWLSCCTFCYQQAGRDPRRVEIRAHFEYAGATVIDADPSVS